jgi:hypothetical protein
LGSALCAKLGNPANASEAARRGRNVQIDAADQLVIQLLPVQSAIQASGANSIGATVKALNLRGIRSPRGGRWHVSSVSNLLARAQRFA